MNTEQLDAAETVAGEYARLLIEADHQPLALATQMILEGGALASAHAGRDIAIHILRRMADALENKNDR